MFTTNSIADTKFSNKVLHLMTVEKVENCLPSVFTILLSLFRLMQERLSSEPPAVLDDYYGISLGLWVSFAEIYNENIYDLLEPASIKGKPRQKLKLGKSNEQTYIKGLRCLNVTSGLEAYQVLQYGLHNLNYAATKLNSHSSRSHFIFTIKLVQCLDYKIHEAVVSSFHFCDLAGSERLKKTMNEGDRLRESSNINTSLLVLGRCINNIRNAQYNKEQGMPPFRESKLTQLFQKALMGQEDIAMIVNVNPSQEMFDETHHVLNFSAIAQDIICEKQSKVILPRRSRFSDYLQSHRPSTSTVKGYFDEEGEERIIELNNHVAELYEQISTLKEDAEQERLRLIDGYTELLRQKEEQYERKEKDLRARYEETIKNLQNELKEDVIVLSDDEEDDIVSSKNDEIEELKDIIISKTNEIDELKRNHHREITTYDELLNRRNAKLDELNELLESAKDDYLKFEEEYAVLRFENEQLRNENYQLREKVCEQNATINSLLQKSKVDEEDEEHSESSVPEDGENFPLSEKSEEGILQKNQSDQEGKEISHNEDIEKVISNEYENGVHNNSIPEKHNYVEESNTVDPEEKADYVVTTTEILNGTEKSLLQNTQTEEESENSGPEDDYNYNDKSNMSDHY